MNNHVPPQRPQQTYSEGFWYAVFAAIFYLVSSMILMVNMLGYFLGHYPQKFNLTDSQRTLILQTMMFFLWLAGGAAVFARVESISGNGTYQWTFVNALYFCDVTILTVGFGDIVPTSDAGRGIVFPYSVGGIIMLGLVISSIAKFAGEIGSDKIVGKHFERSRARTFNRSTTDPAVYVARRPSLLGEDERQHISNPSNPIDRDLAERVVKEKVADDDESAPSPYQGPPSCCYNNFSSYKTTTKATQVTRGSSQRRQRPLRRNEKDSS